MCKKNENGNFKPLEFKKGFFSKKNCLHLQVFGFFLKKILLLAIDDCDFIIFSENLLILFADFH